MNDESARATDIESHSLAVRRIGLYQSAIEGEFDRSVRLGECLHVLVFDDRMNQNRTNHFTTPGDGEVTRKRNGLAAGISGRTGWQHREHQRAANAQR